MCAVQPDDLRCYRDCASLLCGFAGGLRRSEITGLDCGPEQTRDGGGWIEFPGNGALLTIRGKTCWRTVETGRGSRISLLPGQSDSTLCADRGRNREHLPRGSERAASAR
jgi:integrase